MNKTRNVYSDCWIFDNLIVITLNFYLLETFFSNRMSSESLPVDYIFTIIQKLIIYCGLSTKPLTKWPALKFIRVIFLAIILLSIIVCSTLSFRLWIFDFKVTMDKVFSVLYTAIYVLATLSLISLVNWQVKEKLLQHCHLVTQATSQCGCIFYKKTLYISFMILIAIMIGAIVILNLQAIFLTYLYKPVYFNKQNHLFFDHPHMVIMAVVTYVFMTFAIGISLVIFFTVCLVDKLEFKYLNKNFSEEDLTEEKTLIEYFNKHLKLIMVVDHANEMFMYFVLILFCATVPCIILSVYSICTTLSMEESVYMWIGIGIMITVLSFLTILPSSLHNEVNFSPAHIF